MASVVLTGGSLLREGFPSSVEIRTKPVNVSQSGICLSMELADGWMTIVPDKDVMILLENGLRQESLEGKIVRVERDEGIVGMRFSKPLPQFETLIA